MDLAAALTRAVYEQGGQQFKLMIVATGERSQLPNVGPTERVLGAGDVCRVEIFPVIDGYQAGVCRTAVVGEPSPEAKDIYANLVECRHIVMTALRPRRGDPRRLRDIPPQVRRARLGPRSPSSATGSASTSTSRHTSGPSRRSRRAGDGPWDRAARVPHRSRFRHADQGHGKHRRTGNRLLSDVTDTDELLRIEVS